MSVTDWEKAVAERDEKIAVLEAQVAEAAKKAKPTDLLEALRTVTSTMDEAQVSAGAATCSSRRRSRACSTTTPTSTPTAPTACSSVSPA